jgi:hypothetical protein
MRRIIIVLLAIALITVKCYAEDTAPADVKVENAEVSGAEPLSAEPMMAASVAGAGDVPDATPGGGIGSSAMPFLSESFQTDLATGAATLSIPITIPPGRKNMQPNIALSYSSNNSNGVCGVGWAIPTNVIQRSTKQGVPKYNDSDTFMFISSGANAELVEISEGQYRAKIESAFMKYVFDGASWTVYDKSGTKYFFGGTAASRQENDGKVYAWYLDRVEDVHGNYITYKYSALGEVGDYLTECQIYLTEIEYTGFSGSGADPLASDKKILFNYEDREDKAYSYRSGWKIASKKRLKAIDVLLNNARVWLYAPSYEYSEDTGRSLLKSIVVEDAAGEKLPAKTFGYQRLEE